MLPIFTLKGTVSSDYYVAILQQQQQTCD